ncbi:MAG: alanine racemase [Clostridiales bacterium]|nr:alanine racemase [Clostridiales bacterium]
MNRAMHRTWVEVDLDRVWANLQNALSKIHEDTTFIAVVKADAYGHGAPALAKLLEEEPRVTAFGVASIDEAIQLRERGIERRILVLGFVDELLAEEIAKWDLTVPLVSARHARAMDREAARARVKVKGQIKIDSGMCRLGIVNHCEQDLSGAVEEALEILSLGNLEVDGIFTHFSTSGWEDTHYADFQYENFKKVLEAVEEKGYPMPFAHCCNSGAIHFHPEFALRAVRSGSLLYAVQPDSKRPILEMSMPMQLRSRIAQIKTVREGAFIGYDCTYQVKGEMQIAIIPAGYADGIPSAMSNKGWLLVGGQKAPVVGKVCMDQLMVDVTGIEGVEEGQVVTVFGQDGAYYQDMFKLCAEIGAHPAQLLCNLTKRVPRVYYKDGEIAFVEYALI